jgi:hypothetical protein
MTVDSRHRFPFSEPRKVMSDNDRQLSVSLFLFPFRQPSLFLTFIFIFLVRFQQKKGTKRLCGGEKHKAPLSNLYASINSS